MKTAALWSVLLGLCSGGCGSDLAYIRKDLVTEASWRALDRSPAEMPANAAVKPPPTEIPIKPIDVRGSYVAVFDINDRARKLSPSECDGLSDYVATKIAEGGLFQVVPRGEIKARLKQEKDDSFKQCYEESCQIEIGREMAAQKTLNVTISAVGSSCLVTATLFDLRKSVSDATATSRGECSSDKLLEQVEVLIAKLKKMVK